MFCMGCGTKLEEGDIFCSNCGKKQFFDNAINKQNEQKDLYGNVHMIPPSQNNDNVRTPSESKSKNTRLLLKIAVGIVAVVICVFGVVKISPLITKTKSSVVETNQDKISSSEDSEDSLLQDYPEGAVLIESSSGSKNKTLYNYDNEGRLGESVVYVCNSQGEWIPWQFEVNDYYREDTTIKNTDTYTCDAEGNITKVTTKWYSGDGLIDNIITSDLLNGTTSYRYYRRTFDELGRIETVQITDENGDVISEDTYIYDGSNDLPDKLMHFTSSIVATNSLTEYTYDNEGNCTLELYYTYSKGDWQYYEKTEREFDNNGNLTKEQVYENDPDVIINSDNTVEYGDVKWTIEENNLYTYDSNNHLIKEYHNNRNSGDKSTTYYTYGDINESADFISISYDYDGEYSYDKNLLPNNFADN